MSNCSYEYLLYEVNYTKGLRTPIKLYGCHEAAVTACTRRNGNYKRGTTLSLLLTMMPDAIHYTPTEFFCYEYDSHTFHYNIYLINKACVSGRQGFGAIILGNPLF